MSSTPIGRKRTFDPLDARRVRHTKLGVWDVYEEIRGTYSRIPGSSWLEKYEQFVEGLPYMWRMIKDVSGIPYCTPLLLMWVALDAISSMVPALSLWYQGQLLHIVQVAIDTRSVDKRLLFRISAGRIACVLFTRVLSYCRTCVARPLYGRIERYYDTKLFAVRARMDLPTFESTSIQRQVDEASGGTYENNVAFSALSNAKGLVDSAIQLFSQTAVLVAILGAETDGLIYALLGFSLSLVSWLSQMGVFRLRRVWAATTRNSDYVRMMGLKRLVKVSAHRKEVIAGNLADFLTRTYTTISERLGDAGEGYHAARERESHRKFSLYWWMMGPLRELPQILFTLRSANSPGAIPVSLATMNLIDATTQEFTMAVWSLIEHTQSMGEKFGAVQKLYEIQNIPNRIVDGKVPFPEDGSKIMSGVSLEFRNVSFKYPSGDQYALKGVSFTLHPGQLCVIVGANGSGKSTILKLIVRLYDPDEGQILLGGHDIRTLKLFDLRQAVSCLFQDYTHFPLSIRDNIALGDPDQVVDDERVALAAKLGGAEPVLEKLPEGLNTYLDRPVQDYYGGLPEGTKMLFGRDVSYADIREAGGMKDTAQHGLSGGQLQRLAVARMFMRSLVSDDARVGLLLFDEPSASLDPVAEHDLFDRLRKLRGSKTMLFSSHRFGNLTRHADLILFMNDTAVVESGTHQELLRQDGRYAHIWRLQAQAFL